MLSNANDTFKPFSSEVWNNFPGKWTDVLDNFTGAFKAGEQTFQGSIRKPMEQAEQGIDAIFMMMPMADSQKKDMKEKVTRACRSCEKMYEKYITVTSDLTRESLQINKALIKGEAAEAPMLYDSMMAAVKDMSECMVDSLADTPFDSLKSVYDAVKRSLDSLSNEEKVTKNLIKEMIDLNNKIAKLYASAAKESAAVFKDKKNVMEMESIKDMAEAAGQTLKRMTEILTLPEPTATKYNEAVDNFTDISKKQMDVLKAGIQIPANCFFALADTVGKMQNQMKDMFKDVKPESTDFIFSRYIEQAEGLTRNTIEKTELDKSIPQLIMTYAEMMETARSNFQKALTLPYVTHEELSRFEMKVEKAAEVS